MKYDPNEARNISRGAKPATLKDCALLLSIVALFDLFLVVLFNTVLMLNIIPSESMASTIEPGSIVISNRLERSDIQRYDIMVFRSPERDSEDIYIKRVIGLPGETITVANGKVYAGTELLDDSFLPEAMDGLGSGVYQVPEGCYFMMGDNRNHSRDSRLWDTPEYKSQYVPLEDMVAKAEVSVWPLNQIGSLAWHEDGARTQEENPYQSLTCESCGAAGTLVELSPMIHCERRNDGSAKWVTDCVALRCLSCGETRNAVEGGEACPACGMERSVAVDEIGHAEQGENGLVWVTDEVTRRCVCCGEVLPG